MPVISRAVLRAARALPGTASGGVGLQEILLSWGLMLVFSVLHLQVAGRLFRAMIHKARVDATLDME